MHLHKDHFFEGEEKVLEDFKKIKKSDVIDDASELLYYFNETYDNLLHRQNKVNVLITGTTGAGKSTLINAIFKKELALTGVGEPITQHFTRYTSSTSSINIYDSKGLEYGCYEEFIETTKDFMDEHCIGKHGESENAIHAVWYIINSALGRWQKYEEQICRDLFSNIPIMFVLNKADLTTNEEKEILKRCIQNMHLNNNIGIYNVISIKKSNINIDKCLSCGSDDIVIRNRLKQYMCYDCEHIEHIDINDGRTKLVNDTYNILPKFVKSAFATAQSISFKLKEKSSINIIKTFWDKWEHIHTVNKFLKTIASMMAQLSLLWNIRKHSQQYGIFIANDLISAFHVKDRINLFFHNETHEQKIHCTALGILWNKCLRELNNNLLNEWIECSDHSEDKSICIHTVKKILDQLNGDNLIKIEHELNNNSITNLKLLKLIY